ncbi:MAG: WG repeat-containing protein [Alphaproteobacteria bacterium]|nr:WG repeat-containing protein [Alphaproteobacteria bacterium]
MNASLKKLCFALSGIVILLLFACSRNKTENRSQSSDSGRPPQTETVSGRTSTVSSARGLYLIEQNGRYGLVKKDGNGQKAIIPAEYDKLDWRNWKSGSSLYFFASKNGRTSLFAEDGSVLLADYEEIGFENNGTDFIRIKTKGKYGILSPDLQTILPPEYEKLSNWVNVSAHGLGFGFENTGYMLVFKNRRLGIARLSDGKLVAPAAFDDINYHNGVFIVEDNSARFGAYSLNGDELLPVRWQALNNWNPEVFAVCDNDKCIIKNLKTGQETVVGTSFRRLRVYGAYLLSGSAVYDQSGHKLCEDVDDASEFTLFDAGHRPVAASYDTIAVVSKNSTYLLCGSQKWPVKNFYTGIEGAEFWTDNEKLSGKVDVEAYVKEDGVYTLVFDETFNLGKFKNAFDYQ